MQCGVHPQKEAAASCEVCGTALCRPCADRFDMLLAKRSLILIVCETCVLAQQRKVVRAFNWQLLPAGLALIGGIACGGLLLDDGISVLSSSIVATILACSYWGWHFLRDAFIDCLRNVANGKCWGAKVILATCIGVFVAPFVIYGEVRLALVALRTVRQIERGQI